MPTEEGVIKKTSDQMAVVRIEKSSCCTSCDSRGSCEVLSDKEVLVEVRNDLQAKVGDRVVLSVTARSLLKLSLLVYLMPIVALIIGAYAGGVWARSLDMQSALPSIVGGILAMGITFYGLKKINRAAEQKRPDYLPRMTRVLFSESAPPSDDNI
jgi:sigma-E factor negative regulatory protein RseC